MEKILKKLQLEKIKKLLKILFIKKKNYLNRLLINIIMGILKKKISNFNKLLIKN